MRIFGRYVDDVVDNVDNQDIVDNDVKIKICDHSTILGTPLVNRIAIYFYLDALV